MKKAIPVIIAIILIFVIGLIAFGDKIFERYTYSKEQADLKEYFSLEDEEDIAIFLQNEMLEEHALLKEGVCYLNLDLIHQYLNPRFYADVRENWLIYTTPTEIIKTSFESTNYTITEYDGTEKEENEAYTIAFLRTEGEEMVVYVALDYIKKYTNFEYYFYENPNHMQLVTSWEKTTLGEIKKDTAVRVLGGIKSPILRELSKGETVTIVSQMETWSEIRTEDSYVGYVENKYLQNVREEQPDPVIHYIEPEYTSLTKEKKISLGWYVGGQETFDELISSAKGLNTIAPVWFSLKNNEGDLRSIADAGFVQRAHERGIEVWGVVDDFNYAADSGNLVDVQEVLSASSKRQALISNLISEAKACGMDGINVDFEKVEKDTGEDFVQFLRELSIQCRGNELILSVDNYVPLGFNDYFNREEQGVVADYVIIMGYDEHWRGCGEAGSVASIDYVKNGIEKTKEEVPNQKIINALPFYTRVWKTEGVTVTDSALTMENTPGFIERNGLVIEWDEETCQNYAEWERDGATYQVWFEDMQSTEAKLNVMKANEIGGVAVWRLGYEYPQIWDLISAYSAQ